MKKIISSLLICTLFLSCSSRTEVEWKVIGYCCGECSGSCFSGYYIEKESIYKISGKYCDNYDISNKTILEKNEFETVRNVLAKLPSDYVEFSGQYGCPDCRDQCAVFVSYKLDGNIKEIILDPDPGMHPKEFEEFVSAMLGLQLF